MAPSKPAYDVDWVVSTASNSSVANHPDWFISYTPFNSLANGAPFSNDKGLPIIGVGDVELSIRTSDRKSGSQNQRKVLLRDVIHVPTAVCNTIGLSTLIEYELDVHVTSGKLVHGPSGACWGIMDGNKLRLRGQSSTTTSRLPSTAYTNRANWPSSERERCSRSKKSLSNAANELRANQVSGVPSNSSNAPKLASADLTAAERTWLKDNYKGEFYFLRCFGLSVYEDEDREEGRRILRAFMQASNAESSTDEDADGELQYSEDDNDEESIHSFEADMEADPAAHFADHFFTKAQLGWIKKHYRHSGNFLNCYGLKSDNDNDCHEGKIIMEVIMEDDAQEASTRRHSALSCEDSEREYRDLPGLIPIDPAAYRRLWSAN